MLLDCTVRCSIGKFVMCDSLLCLLTCCGCRVCVLPLSVSITMKVVQHAKGSLHGTGNEESVQRLMALGFQRQQCLEVLAACGENEDQAASLLFEMGGGLGL